MPFTSWLPFHSKPTFQLFRKPAKNPSFHGSAARTAGAGHGAILNIYLAIKSGRSNKRSLLPSKSSGLENIRLPFMFGCEHLIVSLPATTMWRCKNPSALWVGDDVSGVQCSAVQCSAVGMRWRNQYFYPRAPRPRIQSTRSSGAKPPGAHVPIPRWIL